MIRLALLALFLVTTDLAHAQGATDIYSNDALASDQPRYEGRIHKLFQAGLWNYMDADEKSALSEVVIELPPRGSSPLDAYSERSNGTPTVVLPILTLKFIEDLCAAYAWRARNAYSLEPMDEYVAMLKYRRPDDFPDGRPPGRQT